MGYSILKMKCYSSFTEAIKIFPFHMVYEEVQVFSNIHQSFIIKLRSLIMLYCFKHIKIDVITKDHYNMLKVVRSLNFSFTGTHKMIRLQYCR